LSGNRRTVASAEGSVKPLVLKNSNTGSLRLEFNSAVLVDSGVSPFNLDVVGYLSDNGSVGSSPVRSLVLVSVNGDRGDKDVSSSEVAIAVHDVEGDEGSPEEEHHDRRENSRNSGSTEFSANNEASECEDNEADD